MDRALITDLLPAVSAALGDETGWIVSGSVAMCLHGLNLTPRDLDLWCTDATLERLAARFKQTITARRTKYFESRVIDLSMLGWEVELSGTVELNNGVQLKVDEAILARAKGLPPVESPEDVLAELLALNREPPKNDFARACALYELFERKIDSAYLRTRLRTWRVDEGLIEQLVGHRTQGT